MAGSCDASFIANNDGENTVVAFNFTGSTGAGEVNFQWNFGDGHQSTEENPVHTYDESGVYTVSLMIEITSPDLCIDIVWKEVLVGKNYCQAYFTYTETGPPGTVCFSNDSQWQGNIESWSWDFGDGSEGSNEENPCHAYDCNKPYTVSLTLETTGGSSSVYEVADIVLNFLYCCTKQAKTQGEAYYSENLKRIKYKQKHLHLPFIHRVNAKVKNYKLNANGNWKFEKADLQIELIGDVFLPNSDGCDCAISSSIDDVKHAFNKKKLTLSKGVGENFNGKKGCEWRAIYTVDDILVRDQEIGLFCSSN